MRPFYLFKPIMNDLFESLSYAIPTVVIKHKILTLALQLLLIQDSLTFLKYRCLWSLQS